MMCASSVRGARTMRFGAVSLLQETSGGKAVSGARAGLNARLYGDGVVPRIITMYTRKD